ncbi:MAG: hypothetical protein Q4F71_11830 [Paracoccus sp. (in: a-proteobacteria)]|nr:hypothetical protein [Paracoccus sp. (in: a-proteobacteria)]
MTQLIAHYKVTDYASFKTAFDAAAENRAQAGLSLLQLWRESGSSAWALYNVSDGARARDYLDGAAGVFNSQAGVSATSFHFVETA